MLFPDPLVSLPIETIQSLPVYDVVAYACGRFALPYLECMGARRTAWIPFAWDPHLHPRPERSSIAEFDVGFVGEWRLDRERWLDALRGYRVAVFGGPAWRRRARQNSVARQSWQGGIAWGAAYASASRSARITLNLVDVTNGPGLNMRAFEAAGIGCFVLSTRTAALEEIFVEGEHIAYFDTPTQLREKVAYFLGHAAERERIAQNAATLAESHTYAHRARELLAIATGE
jgi:spore maturation protein CgeB